MKDSKIVFFGPVGAGKTTAIKSLCGTTALSTDVQASDSTQRTKRKTTVAMDYALFEDAGRRIHLYGTPGQERFRFMWELIATELAHDSSGHILLLDNARNHPRQDLEFYLSNFLEHYQNKPLIIAVTGSDLVHTPTQADYAGWLTELNIKAPVFFIDARNPEDVHFLIDEIVQPPHPVTSGSDQITVQEEVQHSEQIIRQAKLNQRFTSELMQDIEQLPAVNGVALINGQGKTEYSSLTTPQLKELKHFTQNITPLLDKVDDFDGIDTITLDTEADGYFSVLIADHRLLGVHCTDQITMLMLKQEINNLMQWSRYTPAC